MSRRHAASAAPKYREDSDSDSTESEEETQSSRENEEEEKQRQAPARMSKKRGKPSSSTKKPEKVQRQKLEPSARADEGEGELEQQQLDSAEAPYETGQRVLELMRVAYTGARPGDILEGTNPVTKGALLRVCSAPILPMKRKLDEVRESRRLWLGFLHQLAALPFFTPMSIGARQTWLANNQVSKERMGSEDDEAHDAVRFEVLSLGSSVLGSDKIAEADVAHLMEGEPCQWQATDIARMIPANEESNSSIDSGRHTLFFIKSWWKISSDAALVSEFAGPTIDLVRGMVFADSRAAVQDTQQAVQLYLFEGVSSSHGDKVALAAPHSTGAATSFEHVLETVIVPLLSEIPELGANGALLRSQILFIEQQLRPLSGAALKSILQKLIRFPSSKIIGFFPRVVEGAEPEIDARIQLVAACCVLLHRPPTFNEDIGRHVSGMESFLKRLAVILFEDASFTDHGCMALSLLAGALMAQRIRGWRPPIALLARWLKAALAAQRTVSAFFYDSKKGYAMPAIELKVTSSALEASSVLLDALKSMKGDHGMVRFLATVEGGPRLITAGSSLCERQHYSHFVDQHAYPNVAYAYDQQVVDAICVASPPGQPFAALMDKLFAEVTGVNPRRVKLDYRAFEALPFVQATRIAQQRTLFAQLCRPCDLQTGETGQYAFRYELDRSWLAGMVGAIELKGRPRNARTGVTARPPLLETLSCDDPSQLFVLRKPARGLKPEQAAIADDVEAEAMAEGRAMLSSGDFVLRAINRPPVAEWKNARVAWDEERKDYWIRPQRDLAPPRLWEEARFVDASVPVFPAQPFDWEVALTLRSTGIQSGAFERLTEMVRDRSLTSDKLLYRVRYYLKTFDSEITINRVARDGSGMEWQVNTIDGEVYRWLLRLSWLFPGALRPATSNLNKFTVPNGVLLWHVVEKLLALMLERQQPAPPAAAAATALSWSHERWAPPKQPWLHQTEAVEDMKAKHALGREAQYLRSPAGSGKTLMVSMYLKYLAAAGKLADHVVWSGPQESLFSVTEELQSFGFVVDWMIPLKGAKKKKLPPGVRLRDAADGFAPFRITVVDHDHLRLIPELLRNSAYRMCFIIDEVQKTLNDSQRSSIALEVAALTGGGFVALTGTPLTDNKIYKLLPWLSLIVVFTVNKHNFWAACNSWISQIASTGVHVHVHDVDLAWPRDTTQEQEYRSLVPEKLGGRNNFPSRAQIQRATDICYDVCTNEMVRLTVDLLYNTLGYGKPDVWQGGVFIVAENAAHQTKLQRQIVVAASRFNRDGAPALREQDVFLVSAAERIHLSDDSVANGKSPDYPVVITTKRKSLGYTVSRLKKSVTSVYPSNFADRTQLDARVNRLSQRAKELDYYVVSIGVLSIIRKYHNEAASMDRALRDMAIAISNVEM